MRWSLDTRFTSSIPYMGRRKRISPQASTVIWSTDWGGSKARQIQSRPARNKVNASTSTVLRSDDRHDYSHCRRYFTTLYRPFLKHWTLIKTRRWGTGLIQTSSEVTRPWSSSPLIVIRTPSALRPDLAYRWAQNMADVTRYVYIYLLKMICTTHFNFFVFLLSIPWNLKFFIWSSANFQRMLYVPITAVSVNDR